MIVVRVELHSAVSGRVIDLGTAIIDNVGGTKQRGNYRARAYRKGLWERFAEFGDRRGWAFLRESKPHREGSVKDHPRLTAPIWTLVRKALESMEY